MLAAIEAPLIIVVEDSDEDFDTFEEAVCRSGLVTTVCRANTGGDLLALLRGATPTRPALVLMDLNTSGTDGRQALEAIKIDPGLRSCPVVVFSTSASAKDVAFCYEAGANAYHVKPVRYPEHVQAIIDLLSYWLTRAVLSPAVYARRP